MSRTVVLHTHRGRKGNKIKRRQEGREKPEREARQSESEKEEVRLEVR